MCIVGHPNVEQELIENTFRDFISAIRYIMPESVLDSSLPENHCFCPFATQVKFNETFSINQML